MEKLSNKRIVHLELRRKEERESLVDFNFYYIPAFNSLQLTEKDNKCKIKTVPTPHSVDYRLVKHEVFCNPFYSTSTHCQFK